ncbi:MAG TPA: permease-like cell division protein FtsX [Anaeromyxobacteraceae bacterium]|nr:permease-like cell division protein FtsX [Anaeromyxobacteraceae bacterium]
MPRLAYFVRRALDALRRGPFVALVAVGTIFVAVLVTGLFAAVLSGTERLLGAWGGEVQISVYLHPGADLSAARAAAERIASGRAVEAVTSREALRRLRASLGDEAGVLEGVGEAALPASVEVQAPGITLEAARALAGQLQAVPGAAEVDYGNAWLERLETFLGRARLVGLLLMGALSLATAVLVANTLRLAVYARRDEIEIMKLVGATDGFVGAPFLIEGLLQGLLGAGLAVLALLGVQAALLPRLASAVKLASRLTRADVLPTPLLLGLLGGGALLGLLASTLSLLRFLRRI